MGKYKDIDDFIKELADWDPHTEFNDLIKIPVQRNRKGEIIQI